MIGRLDHLMETGITALELMPLAGFAGSRNWGYDGVLWYAPDGTYGRPDDLKALIDEAHLRGLMVFLDVVYNHFGPEGNYLGRYAPDFFTEAQTPWQRDRLSRGARFTGNALYCCANTASTGCGWMCGVCHSFRRNLDADDLTRRGDLAIENRPAYPSGAETRQPASLLMPHPPGYYRAQWNDDYHHAWYVC
jgi:hypothetical protein